MQMRAIVAHKQIGQVAGKEKGNNKDRVMSEQERMQEGSEAGENGFERSLLAVSQRGRLRDRIGELAREFDGFEVPGQTSRHLPPDSGERAQLGEALPDVSREVVEGR